MPGSIPQGMPRWSVYPPTQLDDLRSPLRFLLGHTQLQKELEGLTLSSTA